jgi:hypothetical protein
VRARVAKSDLCNLLVVPPGDLVLVQEDCRQCRGRNFTFFLSSLLSFYFHFRESGTKRVYKPDTRDIIAGDMGLGLSRTNFQALIEISQLQVFATDDPFSLLPAVGGSVGELLGLMTVEIINEEYGNPVTDVMILVPCP